MVSTIDASEFFASHARDLLLATAVFPAIVSSASLHNLCGCESDRHQFLIYVLRQVIYNIYFHPLSSYPGPKLFAAARLTHLSRLVTGNLTRTVTELHQKYGEVVRIAPDELSFNGPQAWRDIYGHRQGHKGLIKEPKFLGLPPEGVHNIFTTPSDADHSRMRKLLAHAFSERALREQESLITSYIDLLISNLHDQIRGPTQGTVNLVKWYNFTTFDIIGDLSFGESFHCLESGEYHPWIAVIFKAIRFGTILHAARHYPPLTEMLALLLPSHLAEQRKKRSIFNKTKVDTRLKLGTSVDRPDFMSYVLRYNDERGMTVPEIHSNSIILITAGSETTATFLCGVTYHLLRNHEPYQKLLEEVRTSFESEDEINSTTVSQLPYLAAVIEEGLRIYPPVPCTVARVTAPEGIEICGRHVPGNVSLRLLCVLHYPSEVYRFRSSAS